MCRIKACQIAIYMLSCFFVEDKESENISNSAIIVFFAKRTKIKKVRIGANIRVGRGT